MTFVTFPGKSWDEILPHAHAEEQDMVSQLIRYQSTDRLSAAEVNFPIPGIIVKTRLLTTNNGRF